AYGACAGPGGTVAVRPALVPGRRRPGGHLAIARRSVAALAHPVDRRLTGARPRRLATDPSARGGSPSDRDGGAVGPAPGLRSGPAPTRRGGAGVWRGRRACTAGRRDRAVERAACADRG